MAYLNSYQNSLKLNSELPKYVHACFKFAGIEISDVLKIDDKDYSITFSLYFNVQWSEPRLNLSTDFFDTENITGDEQLVPGKEEKLRSTACPFDIRLYLTPLGQAK